jgi:acetylornithine/N-succinyldiaminopimelate aminotransferase
VTAPVPAPEPRPERAAPRVSALAPTYARYPVEFASGQGCVLRDADGVEYLDFLAGIAVCSLGHCHPAVVEAVREQATRLLHVSNLFTNAPMVRLAERLVERSFAENVYFANSGAEANEAAIKLVRKARPRGDIVVAQGAFHGRTYGALSATPQESKQAPFAPLVPGFRAVAPTVEAVTAAVDDQTAAVLLEPVQGESGVHPLADDVLRAAREACDRAGAALVFDEVQCGVGRTGTLWAYEQSGVVPDAMTLAKGLGGGMPIGALLIGPRLDGVFAPGDHGSTFAGGPVAAAAANAVLDVVDDPAFLSAVHERGERLAEGLRELPAVTAIRSRGLMVAADVDADAPDLARRALLEQHLIVNATGPGTLRFLPPLVVSEAEIDEALSRLAALLSA